MFNRKLQKLWDEYHERFGSWFPLMCFPNDSNEELEKKLSQCLNANQKAEKFFNLDYGDGFFY